MENQKFKWKIILYGLIVTILLTGQSWAITLSFEPSASDIFVGKTVDIDIYINDLDNDDLAGFDFTVNFDNTILNFDSYALGIGLGDRDLFESSDMSSGDLGAGNIHIAEVSWLWDFTFQPDSFLLASLSFTANSAGMSNFTFSNVTLSPSPWDPAALESTLGEGSANAAPVPEPSTIVLLATGLLGLAGFSRKKNK